MPTNEKSYQRQYMLQHNTPTECDICHGHYRKYFKKHHEKTSKHKQMVVTIACTSLEKRIALSNVFKAQKERIQLLEQQLETHSKCG